MSAHLLQMITCYKNFALASVKKSIVYTYLARVKADTFVNEQGAINNSVRAHKHGQFYGRGLRQPCSCDSVTFHQGCIY